MKNQITIWLLFAALLVTTAFRPAKSTGKADLLIKKGKITIHKTTVSGSWALADFQKALGVSGRTREGYNKTHTYDDLGIVLFEKTNNKIPSGIINEFQYYFNVETPNEVTPTGVFSGKIKIGKVNITSGLSATDMQNKLSDWSKTDSYISHSYRMQKGNIYIYFQYNEAETGIQKVSVGLSTR